jgi:hypothetical protein
VLLIVTDWRDTSRCETQRGESFVLKTHSKDKCIIWDNLVIVIKNDILVTAININHSSIDNSNSSLKHKSLELFLSVAGGVRFEVLGSLISHVMMREAAGCNQYNVSELKVSNREQGLDKGNASVRGTHHHDTRILNDLRLTQKSLSSET